MTWLTIGVALWSVVHLFPSVMPAQRASLVEKTGEKQFKGLFALEMVIALGLIVYGWRTAAVEPVY
ncbi:MAG: NnrU family protein, partial [Woeseiaceae bacterium]